MNAFKKDAFHFLKYFSLNAVVFGFLAFVLWKTNGLGGSLSMNATVMLLIPVGLVTGLVSATAFHNASHGNIKPRRLNALIGELTASFSLEDLRCFRVGHMLHHIHTDDPELDPHPPKGLTFFGFIMSSRQKTIECISRLYYQAHGAGPAQRRNVLAQIILFHVAALAKVVFWFLLFGKTGFLFFFVPAYLAYFFGFAHLNYASHQDDEHGVAEVSNHDGTLFYRVMNFLTSGGYYHRNHHLAPGLYNPSKLSRAKAGV